MTEQDELRAREAELRDLRARYAADLDAARARYAALESHADALAREASETARALTDALGAQRAALERAGESAAKLAAIRASNSGRLSAVYASWRVRLRRARLEAKRRAWLRRAGRRRLAVPQAVQAAAPGVNVAGYINAESGMGEAARCSIRALQRAGLPVALNNVKSAQRTHDRTFTVFTDDNPQPINLIHLNADNMAWFASEHGRGYFADRYTIGYWFWELEAFRPDWLSAFDLVDEVWVASEHTRKAIGDRAPVPVVHVPLGLPEPVAGNYGRAHFGLPDRPFIFLYTFDVSSQMERKNPMAAVRAFRLANLPHDEAMLLLKFTNADANRDAVRQLTEAATGLNVQMLDGALDREEVGALMRATDACLSLHRAEGFGLTLAEQMALGKPAIATAYSGNVDFMNEEVSCMVPARLIEIDRDYGPYLTGYHWAEPDVEAAAGFIRDLAEHPVRARELGAKGRTHVNRVLSLDRSATLMQHRLDQIRRGDLRISGVAPKWDDRVQEYGL